MEEMGTGPTLLLAMPQMTDPNFNRSVVLLCRHDEEGALGFVLNRPMEIDVADLLEGDFPISGSPSLTAWQGGPVSPERGWLICRELPTRSEEDPEEFLEVCRGIYMSSSQTHLRTVLELDPGCNGLAGVRSEETRSRSAEAAIVKTTDYAARLNGSVL